MKIFHKSNVNDGNPVMSATERYFDVPAKWRCGLPKCFKILQWIYPGTGKRIGVFEFVLDPYPIKCKRVFIWKSESSIMTAIRRLPHFPPPEHNPVEKTTSSSHVIHGDSQYASSDKRIQRHIAKKCNLLAVSFEKKNSLGIQTYHSDRKHVGPKLHRKLQQHDGHYLPNHDRGDCKGKFLDHMSQPCRLGGGESIMITAPISGEDTDRILPDNSSQQTANDIDIPEIYRPEPTTEDKGCHSDTSFQVKISLEEITVGDLKKTDDISAEECPIAPVKTEISAGTITIASVKTDVSLGEDVASCSTSVKPSATANSCGEVTGISTDVTPNHVRKTEVQFCSAVGDDSHSKLLDNGYNPVADSHARNEETPREDCFTNEDSTYRPAYSPPQEQNECLVSFPHSAELNNLSPNRAEALVQEFQHLLQEFEAPFSGPRVELFNYEIPDNEEVLNLSSPVTGVSDSSADDQEQDARHDISYERLSEKFITAPEHPIHERSAHTPQDTFASCQESAKSQPREDSSDRLAPGSVALGISSSPTNFAGIPLPIIAQRSLRILCDADGPRVIGQGAFGKVYQATVDTISGYDDVVIKMFRKKKSHKLDIIDEAKILSHLNSSGFVPKFYGLTTSFAIVQEYFGDGCTLDRALTSYHDVIPRLIWLGIAQQLAVGLEAIHQRRILNNDIKEDNILVECRSGRYPVRYIDFGNASYNEGLFYRINKKNWGRCTHLAPEVRSGQQTRPSSDVYSLGRVLRRIMMDVPIAELSPIVSPCVSEELYRPSINSLVGWLTTLQHCYTAT